MPRQLLGQCVMCRKCDADHLGDGTHSARAFDSAAGSVNSIVAGHIYFADGPTKVYKFTTFKGCSFARSGRNCKAAGGGEGRVGNRGGVMEEDTRVRGSVVHVAVHSLRRLEYLEYHSRLAATL